MIVGTNALAIFNTLFDNILEKEKYRIFLNTSMNDTKKQLKALFAILD